jgi:hypothetical protein
MSRATIDMLKGWGELAVRYRWFVGFGLVWFAIVLMVSPVVSLPSDEAQVQYASPATEEVAGTMGSVSAPRSPQAGAVEAIATGPADTPSGFGPQADYAGFEPSEGEQDFSGPEEGDGTGGETEPEHGPCATDEQLPAPVATTVVDTIGGLEDQVGGATGQAPPADVSDTAGGALGCGNTEAAEGGAAAPAPSLSSDTIVGGLSPVDLLHLLLGLGVPQG